MERIKTLLVANRAEIATRILKTARLVSLAQSDGTLPVKCLLTMNIVGSYKSRPLQSIQSLTRRQLMSRKQTSLSCFRAVLQKLTLMGTFPLFLVCRFYGVTRSNSHAMTIDKKRSSHSAMEGCNFREICTLRQCLLSQTVASCCVPHILHQFHF